LILATVLVEPLQIIKAEYMYISSRVLCQKCDIINVCSFTRFCKAVFCK